MVDPTSASSDPRPFDEETLRHWHHLREAAQGVARSLFANGKRVIFAESCTSGLCAAALGQVPGISGHLSGSAVTYRPQVKIDWLNVSPDDIEQFTTESAEITAAMARGVLSSTTDPDYSAAITGHLGPIDDATIDGIIFIAVAERTTDAARMIHSCQTRLETGSRTARQAEAATVVLRELGRAI